MFVFELVFHSSAIISGQSINRHDESAKFEKFLNEGKKEKASIHESIKRREKKKRRNDLYGDEANFLKRMCKEVLSCCCRGEK